MSETDSGVPSAVATSVNVKGVTVTTVSFTHFPYLYAPLCWFCGHVLFEKYSAFVADHGLVNA